MILCTYSESEFQTPKRGEAQVFCVVWGVLVSRLDYKLCILFVFTFVFVFVQWAVHWQAGGRAVLYSIWRPGRADTVDGHTARADTGRTAHLVRRLTGPQPAPPCME